MPNTRISNLTAATSVAGTDVYPSVQTAGVGPVKTSLTDITAFALANAPAGAVATPSIAPTGDTNTGFWFPAADTIAASTGGSERMRITSAGLVGIGTTSPAVLLDARGDASVGARSGYAELSLHGPSSLASSRTANFRKNWDSPFDFNIYASSGTSGNSAATVFYRDLSNETMRIDSAGRVGIGTASPSTTLDVRAAQATFGLTSTTTTNAAYSSFNNAGGIFYAGIDNSGGSAFSGTAYSSVLWSTAATPMVFATNGSEKMRITSAGNVGIGTTLSAWGSQVALQMGGGSAGGISLVGGNQELGANYYITSGGNYTYIANTASTLYSMFGGQHRWFTAASGTAGNTITFSEAMRITSAGNVHTPAGSTGMTNGFFYMPAAAGAPSGTPTSISGTVPFYYDTTNNQFYVYNGSWKKVALA